MSVDTPHHAKAMDDPHHMCKDPIIMMVIPLDHMKALTGTHHMTEKSYIMVAITHQHVPSPQGCRLVLVEQHHPAQM